MTDRIAALRSYILSGGHHAFRRRVEWKLADGFAASGLSPERRSAAAFAAVLGAEEPKFIPGLRFAMLRTVVNLPKLYTEEEEAELHRQHTFAEKGVPFNFTPDYASVLELGLLPWREATAAQAAKCDAGGREFLRCSLSGIDALIALVGRYRDAAAARGLTGIAANLDAVLRGRPATLEQAFQLFRILHFAAWCEGGYHIGVGRADQLFLPWYRADIASGTLDRESAMELLEEFFLTFNCDSDLYCGVQQGDNGQSLMIGGCDPSGNDAWNELSGMILDASCALKLIDPKINFRVNASTPRERLEQGSRLTRAGLGFPQYSNDDVIIPALLKWGYSLADARNYSCAACWEIVIPGVCQELINLDAVSLPEVLLEVMEKGDDLADFDAFCGEFRRALRRRAEALIRHYRDIAVLPSPFISALCPVALRAGRNIAQAGRYRNWGIHGTGFAVAADSLASLREMVFTRRSVTLAALREALRNDFAAEPELLGTIRNRMPKLGGYATEAAQDCLAMLVRWWAEAWDGLRNAQGGIVRPGTGSAMYYIWHSRDLSATPDGRRRGEPFPANFSPALDVPLAGPLSVIRAFTSCDLTGVCNGGPLTIELHASVFTAPDAERKVAAMIAEFIRRGGHQLQLNTIDGNLLREAQKHPENHRNLVVRVWGWSGRFVELDKVYQDHIIRRSEMVFS